MKRECVVLVFVVSTLGLGGCSASNEASTTTASSEALSAPLLPTITPDCQFLFTLPHAIRIAGTRIYDAKPVGENVTLGLQNGAGYYGVVRPLMGDVVEPSLEDFTFGYASDVVGVSQDEETYATDGFEAVHTICVSSNQAIAPSLIVYPNRRILLLVR